MLTGEHVYKIKKPVNLGFLDYSTLDKRRRACAEELRLNRALAPELYLGVVPITGPVQAPVINGTGPAIEYAVHMRQFDRAQQLDQLLEAGRLSECELDRVADYVAALHAAAPRLDANSAYGRAETVHAAARDNLRTLLALYSGRHAAALGRLQAWSETEYLQLRALMDQRCAHGWVREVHGDLHLANLAVYNGRLLAFDRIEFDPGLRWLDVLNDAAFLAMDLLARDRQELAFRFLNRYLQNTGDYRGLPLWRYFLVYRALVRAKVTRLQADQQRTAGSGATRLPGGERYIALADTLLSPASPRLVLMHGYSGSGKTWVSAQLMTRLPAVRLRSDAERKRLHGLAPQQASNSGPAADLYSAAASARTYRELAALAEIVLMAGYHVIVDAAFLRQSQRRELLALAARRGLRCVIVACHADDSKLRQRLQARASDREQISEADAAILDLQLQSAEPLDEHERSCSVWVDTGQAFDAAAVAAEILALRSAPGT